MTFGISNFARAALRVGLTLLMPFGLAACDGGFGGRLDPVIASPLGPDVHALATGAERRLVLAAQIDEFVPTGKTVIIDGTKREVLTVREKGALVVCAEPSPDALEALSASVAARIEAARGQDLQAKAELTRDITTSVGSVLKRSQGLQLFRDGVFALCQGSMNGLRTPELIAKEFRNLTNQSAELIMMEIKSDGWNATPVIKVSATPAPAPTPALPPKGN